MPVVIRSFELLAGDSTIWLFLSPILRKNNLLVIRGIPPLFPFHPSPERTSFLEYPNSTTHALSGIRTELNLALRKPILPQKRGSGKNGGSPKGPLKPCSRIVASNGNTERRNNLAALHFKYDQARRRFVEWAQTGIAVVPDFHKRILFSDEAHFWLNGYVNKQNCRIWSEANPQVYVETPLHPEKLTVWCALWAGGILLQKR
ncbi:hypothetical protein TNCV_2334641 [Trichonephila clavipes]|nr:hypothetical protein TNCV_2334641 [Trichonephila clavipes]